MERCRADGQDINHSGGRKEEGGRERERERIHIWIVGVDWLQGHARDTKVVLYGKKSEAEGMKECRARTRHFFHDTKVYRSSGIPK